MALLVSELINNAVLHGGAAANDKVTLRISVAPERVRVEVSDAGVGFRRLYPQQPSPDGIGGYGLVLVDMLASRWDVDTDAGTCVWFELDRRSERTAR